MILSVVIHFCSHSFIFTANATNINQKRTYEVDRRQQMRIYGIKEMENVNVAEQTDRDHIQI